MENTSKQERTIQIGDVILFERIKKDGYEFYQLTDRHQYVPKTGFPEISPNSDQGQDLLRMNIGDQIKNGFHSYTIKNFFSPEDALYRLTAADETKDDINYASRGDYVLCTRPKGLEVIRWGLISDENINVFGLTSFYDPKGIKSLPPQFEIGKTYPYTCGYSPQPIKVESAISDKTFQKRFGIPN